MRKTARHAALAVFVVLGCTPADGSSLSFDGGGRLGDYLDGVAQANAGRQRTEIDGVCASACTVKLGARDVCIHPHAELWFHAASDADGRVNALGTLMMSQEYPRAIRAWAISHAALSTSRFARMSGAQAIALGVPNCEHDQRADRGGRPRFARPPGTR